MKPYAPVPLIVLLGALPVASQTFTEFPTPSGTSWPVQIAPGPDGNLWFTEYRSNRIGRITVQGDITEFPIPAGGYGPLGITAGPDGNVWFTESSGRIGRISMSGVITEFSLPRGKVPYMITTGPDGNL